MTHDRAVADADADADAAVGATLAVAVGASEKMAAAHGRMACWIMVIVCRAE